MATNPTPDQPGQPEAPPMELPTPGGDVDMPGGGGDIDMPSPGGDPGGGEIQPVDMAPSSMVGTSSGGDAGAIGSTGGMAASTGGMAGTSR